MDKCTGGQCVATIAQGGGVEQPTRKLTGTSKARQGRQMGPALNRSPQDNKIKKEGPQSTDRHKQAQARRESTGTGKGRRRTTPRADLPTSIKANR